MNKKPEAPKPARDNRANQLNPNNDGYWRSRDLPRPQPKPDGSVPPPKPAPSGK